MTYRRRFPSMVAAGLFAAVLAAAPAGLAPAGLAPGGWSGVGSGAGSGAGPVGPARADIVARADVAADSGPGAAETEVREAQVDGWSDWHRGVAPTAEPASRR